MNLKSNKDAIEERRKKDQGYRIRAFRRRLDLTQTELARKLSLTKTSVQNWEKGKNDVMEKHIHDLAKILNTTVSYIRYGDTTDIHPDTSKLNLDKIPEYIKSFDLTEDDIRYLESDAYAKTEIESEIRSSYSVDDNVRKLEELIQKYKSNPDFYSVVVNSTIDIFKSFESHEK